MNDISIQQNIVPTEIKISGKVTTKATQNISGSLSINSCSQYEGVYEITPSNAIQILETQDKKCTDNIVINPIPNNYGLITWNGSYLTIS